MVFPKQTVPCKFSRINHRPLAIIDGCNKCCKINTAFDIMDRFMYSREIMADRNGLLQLISSTNRLSINLYMPETKEVS